MSVVVTAIACEGNRPIRPEAPAPLNAAPPPSPRTGLILRVESISRKLYPAGTYSGKLEICVYSVYFKSVDSRSLRLRKEGFRQWAWPGIIISLSTMMEDSLPHPKKDLPAP